MRRSACRTSSSVRLMDLLPCAAQFRKCRVQLVHQTSQLPRTETVGFTQGYWSRGTIELENRFAVRPDDVNVAGCMVVRKDPNCNKDLVSRDVT